ncbi:piggyBac transposable element-derived protein 4-like [Archocentrus centrarchus]|uniref:piggyBac transposable element-derived protein 4-like n=1 Tax=Archocentrus centrarchus TaxID=63155 RepID=UPI0011EA21F7|nr:piggyBac transposable element-derived protein 4-like [Archocentrus centrarchus]XP_030607771.1 piggyBac transposable element-derived protein 4-like [Archocentrus centrarchus]
MKCEEEEGLDYQQVCNQEWKSSLDQEDPEPPQIKKEEEEFWTSQEVEQVKVKQEAEDIVVWTGEEQLRLLDNIWKRERDLHSIEDFIADSTGFTAAESHKRRAVTHRRRFYATTSSTFRRGKMAEQAAGKTKSSTKEVIELLTRRESDVSASEVSDSTDEPTSEDDLLFDGDDQATSDHKWEPAKQSVEDASWSDEEDLTPASARARRSFRSRARARDGDRGRSRSSTRGGNTSTPAADRWHGVEVPDIMPPQPTFCPSRTPGAQLVMSAAYSAVELFQLFFTADMLQKLLANSNEYGRACCSTPSRPWTDITMQDMFGFLSVVIYMGFMQCSSLSDYWRGGKLYSLLFPKSVMSQRKWIRILNALHLSSAAEDSANEAKRGTPEFDRLGKIKPLYMEMREACRRNYHPRQHIAIDERMIASQPRVTFKQYKKGNPVRWGCKLFVLVDSSSGYIWDFFIYDGKTDGSSGKGLGYDAVTKLINTSLLGSGYKLFVDNFYTSPTLFQDLMQQKIWACGTIRTNRIGYPKTKDNALAPTSPRGTIRWLRTGSLLFIQWRDTQDVFLCSTIHTAHSSDTVTRKVKDSNGRRTKKDVSVSPAIREYNQCMGGVDVSDALIGCYQVPHKTRKWYKTFFYHFLDIAIVNAFLLHKELYTAKGQVPMCQKAFRETLAEQLMQLDSQGSVPRPSQPKTSQPSDSQHRLQFISGHRSDGRLRCRVCGTKTAVQCSTCDKPLCFIPKRDCYNQWHMYNAM